MALDYLEDLSARIERGEIYFACPTAQQNHWAISKKRDDLKAVAQHAADVSRCPTAIYRLLSHLTANAGENYLVVRKIVDPDGKGEAAFQWALVGTREAAELVRDVSYGPTPYFGTASEESFTPK